MEFPRCPNGFCGGTLVRDWDIYDDKFSFVCTLCSRHYDFKRILLTSKVTPIKEHHKYRKWMK